MRVLRSVERYWHATKVQEHCNPRWTCIKPCMWLRRLLESRLRLPNQFSITNVGTHRMYVCIYFRARLDSEQLCFPLNLLSKSLLPSLTQRTLHLELQLHNLRSSVLPPYLFSTSLFFITCAHQLPRCLSSFFYGYSNNQSPIHPRGTVLQLSISH
jgi:hypothetical protein